MDYRETVMSAELIRKVNPDECVCGIEDAIELCEHQAEISFKMGATQAIAKTINPASVLCEEAKQVGMREVVEWIENSGLFWRSVSITNRDYYIPLALADAWQAFRKERGL